MGAAFEKAVAVSGLPAVGRTYELTASPEQAAHIAKRLQVPAVRKLSGVVSLRPTGRGAILQGRLDAVLERVCVRSLEPMEETLAEEFEIEFARNVPDDFGEAEFEEDAPEPLIGDTIDIADTLIQQAALAMSPYPHKQDAKSLAETHGDGGPVSPFAVLKGAIAPGGDED